MTKWGAIKEIFGLYKDFADSKKFLGKRWWLSKTLWANAMAVGCGFAASHYGIVISAEDQVAVLGVVNMVVRFTTKQPLVTRAEDIVAVTAPASKAEVEPARIAAVITAYKTPVAIAVDDAPPLPSFSHVEETPEVIKHQGEVYNGATGEWIKED